MLRPAKRPRHLKARRGLSPAEAKGLRVVRPALRRSVGMVADALADRLRQQRPSLAVVSTLPWHAAASELSEAWFPVARRAGQTAAQSAVSVKQLDDRDAEILGELFATDNARRLGQQSVDTTRQGLVEIIVQGRERGWDDRRISQALVDWAGIGPQDAKHLSNQYDLLLSQGTDEARARRALSRRASERVRTRAEMIARTEANDTESGAMTETWARMESQGQIAPGAQVEWVTFNPCKICEAIAAQGPIPLGQQFNSPLQGTRLPHPPAHPRCRCRPRLIPKPF